MNEMYDVPRYIITHTEFESYKKIYFNLQTLSSTQTALNELGNRSPNLLPGMLLVFWMKKVSKK